MRTYFALCCVMCFATIGNAKPQTTTPSNRNVILVLVDGLRWQEVFTGAEESLINTTDGGVKDIEALRKRFWRSTADERRAALMPFLWGTVAKNGQVLGNQLKGSVCKVANTHHFSYPGYSEMICGFPDERIKSNDGIPNPNVTVLEWLNQQAEFRGKVAAIGAWNIIPAIVNRERSGIFAVGGNEPIKGVKIGPAQAALNRVKEEGPSVFDSDPADTVFFYSALEYFKDNRPRVLWMTFGETDEWAHKGRYDEYLNAANRTDRLLAELWKTVQSTPGYKNRTTLIISVDHGRGNAPRGWMGHGVSYKGSDNVWIAVMGPDTPALGERTENGLVYQSSVAATVAASLGLDYNVAQPKAAPVIPGAFRQAAKR